MGKSRGERQAKVDRTGRFEADSDLLLKGSSSMAKFYVQSGLFEIMIQSGDGEGAALWAVHRYLQACDQASHQLFTLRREQAGSAANPSPSPLERLEDAQSYAGDPPDLAETIRCSEIGFGRSDGGVYLTNEVLQKYSELLHALSSLGI
jgi:hypothetical protein